MMKSKQMLVVIQALLLVFTSVCAFGQTKWYDPMANTSEPYVNGRAWNSEIGNSYQRIPDRLKDKLSKGVWNNSHQSAGLSVTFLTTSPTVEVRFVVVNPSSNFRNMAPANHSGVDLYATDANGKTTWVDCRMKWRQHGDTLIYRYGPFDAKAVGGRGLLYTLFLPPYNIVKNIIIGVKENAQFQFTRESRERPIVCYGSSIIQGASPERPGNMITNIVRRELDYPIINLGFSGCALMEPGVFDMMSEINARAFIIDPIPNSYSLHPDTVKARAIAGTKRLRQSSNAPILFVESFLPTDSILIPKVYKEYKDANTALYNAYRELIKEGVKGLYYLSQSEIGITEEDLVEGIHPNDIGNRKYATAYEQKLREMMPEDWTIARFLPIKQHRDGVYNWYDRHNDVIGLNSSTNPEILLIGNSITNFWGGEPWCQKNNGKSAWQKTFGKRRVVNMGFGWDRIENVWWRILHGELDNCNPKHICLLIGINNIGFNGTNEEIADGIAALSQLIHEKQPKAKLHILKILPCRDRFTRIKEVNRLLEQKVKTGNGIELIDIGNVMLSKDGNGINPAYYNGDGLHPNEAGYLMLGKELKKYLK